MATTDAQLVAAIKRHSVPASFVVLDVGIGDCEPRMLLEGVLHYGEFVPCDDHQHMITDVMPTSIVMGI